MVKDYRDVISREDLMARSQDLRERVVESYENGEGSMRQLAARFKVGVNTVKRWVHQYRDKGHLETSYHNCGPRFSLDESSRRKALVCIVNEKPDATLVQMADRFEEMTGHSIR